MLQTKIVAHEISYAKVRGGMPLSHLGVEVGGFKDGAFIMAY